MKRILLLNPEGASQREIKKYPLYKSARAVVLDKNGNVALLHVTKGGYYKLPGGGIEKNENKITAVKRECKEEIGVDIEILGEIGYIKEHRKKFKINQISYCYLAKLIGEVGKPSYTKEEVEEGFEPKWLSFKDAFDKTGKVGGASYEGVKYSSTRYSFFKGSAKNDR